MSAAIITKLIEAGTPADLIAEVAMELARAQAASEVLEQRREKDRQRKRAPRISEESMETSENSGSVGTPSPEVSPQTPFPNPNPSPPAPKGASPQTFVDAWNDMAGRTGLPAVKALTNERRRRLQARVGELGEERVLEAIRAVGKSRFCLGDNDRGWRADFDFVLQPKSCARLIEGTYGNQKNERLTI